MKFSCHLNNKSIVTEVQADESLRSVLVRLGCLSVRDSDDGEGFAGSDTVLVDNLPVFANLLYALEAEGAHIRTAESLANKGELSVVQQALIDAGVVGSAYKAPAAALLLTWLLERDPDPTKEAIKETLSGLLIRDSGYEHYFLAIQLAKEYAKNGSYSTPIAPEFRDHLRFIGKVVPKVDGRQLVSGAKSFVEDRVENSYCHLIMLRSPHAHAYITSIDISEALAQEGVVTIITADNCPDIYYMQAGQSNPEPSPYDRRLFNRKVRHVGDRVAAIVAETMDQARAAKEKIKVTYEVLKPVFSVEEAMQVGAPVVQNGEVEYLSGEPKNLKSYNKGSDPKEGKIIYPFPLHADSKRNIASAAFGEIGDVQKGFAQADTVIERTYRTSQVQCTPLEPHITYTYIDNDRLVVRASTQVPFHVRRIVARVCQIEEHQVRVIKEKVGGGYGSKQDVLVEDVAAYATWLTRRSILYRNTRQEEFIANSTRHPMTITMKMGATKEGKLTAIYMDVRANTGPYGNHCLTVPMNACSKTLPLLNCPNMKFDVTTYYTNIPPTGAYQGYGAPKGSYALMTAFGELAHELGLDPLHMAQKNHVSTGYMLEILKSLGEGREGTVVPVGSCGLAKALEQGAKMINWGHKEKDEGDWKIGKGFAMIQQGSGLPGIDHSMCDIVLHPDGSLMIHSGGADLGTGLDTVSVKCAAEVLCTPLKSISIISGDTDTTLFDTGAFASSGTYFSGQAAKKAAENLKENILVEAALQLGEDVEHLALRYPQHVYSQITGKSLSFAQISHQATSGVGRGQLVGYGSFATMDAAIPYGAHFVQVAVNTKTGQINVQKYYALQDAGTPINPELALCQLYGAALKSIGHTLYEEMILDEEGRCLTADLSSYGVPMISELPEDFQAVLIDEDDEFGPFGAKSISEIATNGAAPAIALAVHDAVGIWLRSWPFTSEKVLRKLKVLQDSQQY